MRKLALVLLLLMSRPVLAPAMMFTTFDVGFNFRNSSAFVTDAACCTFELDPAGVANPAYPTTATVNGSSVTYGWESGAANCDSRDRDNSVDTRLAGIAFLSSTGSGTCTFRVDLPATGTYNIAMALGDATNAQAIKLHVDDTTTALITFTNAAVALGSFLDANGTSWSAAAWPGSNTTKQVTFSTTICRIVLQVPTTLSTTVAHFRITQVSASAKTCTLATMGAGPC